MAGRTRDAPPGRERARGGPGGCEGRGKGHEARRRWGRQGDGLTVGSGNFSLHVGEKAPPLRLRPPGLLRRSEVAPAVLRPQVTSEVVAGRRTEARLQLEHHFSGLSGQPRGSRAGSEPLPSGIDRRHGPKSRAGRGARPARSTSVTSARLRAERRAWAGAFSRPLGRRGAPRWSNNMPWRGTAAASAFRPQTEISHFLPMMRQSNTGRNAI